MATHTNSGGNYGRKFAISRENGQVNKEGRPYFFEWLKDQPGESKNRKFETRQTPNGARHYELFAALDGFLIDVRKETRNYGKGEETHIVLHLIDADDEYHIDMGKPDSRYATDILKRLLNPFFDANKKLRVSPYASEKDGKLSIGISAFSGTDKLQYSQSSDFLQGMPQPRSWEGRNKTEYDFTNVGEWLFEQVKRIVVPNLMKDPISAPQQSPTLAAPEVPTKAQSGGDENFPDDLPF